MEEHGSVCEQMFSTVGGGWGVSDGFDADVDESVCAYADADAHADADVGVGVDVDVDVDVGEVGGRAVQGAGYEHVRADGVLAYVTFGKMWAVAEVRIRIELPQMLPTGGFQQPIQDLRVRVQLSVPQ